MLLAALFSKNKVRARQFLISGIILMYVLGNSFILNSVANAWEIRAADDRQIRMQKPGAILVLGGVSFWDNQLGRLQFNRSGDRILQGYRLFQEGVANLIIISGGSGSLAYPEDRESVFLKDYLLKIKGDPTRILIEKESRNTYENAVETSKLIKQRNIKGPFVLVTSGYHMRRAMACFEKAGIKVIPYSTDRYSGDAKYYFDHLLIPNSANIFAWDAIVHEWVGMLMYKLSGYI